MGERSQLKAYLALLAVYIFWGTTYLGIRMALESFPPLKLISIRFLFSGAIMLIGAKLLRVHLPHGRELWLTAFYGIVMLGGGTGCLVFAEMWIPSGLASMFVTTGAFWIVGLEAWLYRKRLHLPTLAGIAVGFGGVLLLIYPAVTSAIIDWSTIRGFLVLQVGCLLWSGGSILQRRQPTRAHPFVSGAIQQFATGLFYLLPALLVPQEPAKWNAHGIGAMLYLAMFGSIVGYSAYIYALEHLPVPIMSTYTYVNPVVAVTLGWLFYREPFGWREVGAIAIVFTGVALVRLYTGNPKAAVAKA